MRSERVRNRRDVWVEQQPTLDRNPQPNAAQHQDYLDNTGGTSSTYNNRLKYTEGNMANQFPNSNLDAVPVTASQSSASPNSPIVPELSVPVSAGTAAFGGAAALAIDGNTDSWWEGGSCTHTTRCNISIIIYMPASMF